MATTKKTTRVKKTAPAKATRAKKSARATVTRAKKTTRATAASAKKTIRSAATPAKKATRAAATRKGAARKDPTRPANRSNGRRPDAIAFLKQEHRAVEELFSRFERAGSGAVRRKEQLRDSIIEALSLHAAIEELVFYPAVRAGVRGADSDVLEALEEHHVVKVVLRECEDMDPADERFTAKMTVMMENVRHHVKEEERDLFPMVRRSIDRARLLELADELKVARRTAPTRPHPYSPDEPPGNVLVGGAVAVVDRARATGKKAVRRVRREVPGL